jgi:MOSC domain-containing protein YiiM
MTTEQDERTIAGPDTWRGNVEAIYIAEGAGAPMQKLSEVRAIPGQGLEGDRYLSGTGHYSDKPSGGGREITLIEIEAIRHLDGGVITSWGTQLDIKLAGGETRRNIVTSGVPLNHLLDREFWVGDVLMRGTRLCEPCNYLEELTSRPGMRMALMHRGGVRANILNEGVIRASDGIWLNRD